MAQETTRPLVLLVEDDPLLAECLYHLLALHGYEVAVTENGLEALQFLREGHITPDLILANIARQEMDGFELLQTVRTDEHWHTLPFLSLSSITQRSVLQHALNLGATDYLIKPFAAADLLAVIQSHVSPVARA